MISPRLRRLNLDFERLKSRFAGWPLIELSEARGVPPESYRFTYHVRSLYVAADSSILEREQHIMEVNLSLGYPRRAPQCRMLTPVFHPNFDDTTVCIGDFWAASEGLEDLVIRIGRMLAYQEYNVKSPLNGLAARWAEQNAHLLPVDTREVAPPATADPAGSAAGGEAGSPPNAPPGHEAGDWGGRIIIEPASMEPTSKAPPLTRESPQAEAGPRTLRLPASLRFLELKVACQACGQKLLFDGNLLGLAVACPNCGSQHQVVETDTPA